MNLIRLPNPIEKARQEGRDAHPMLDKLQCPYNTGFEGPLWDAWMQGWDEKQNASHAMSRAHWLYKIRRNDTLMIAAVMLMYFGALVNLDRPAWLVAIWFVTAALTYRTFWIGIWRTKHARQQFQESGEAWADVMGLD